MSIKDVLKSLDEGRRKKQPDLMGLGVKILWALFPVDEKDRKLAHKKLLQWLPTDFTQDDIDNDAYRTLGIKLDKLIAKIIPSSALKEVDESTMVEMAKLTEDMMTVKVAAQEIKTMGSGREFRSVGEMISNFIQECGWVREQKGSTKDIKALEKIAKDAYLKAKAIGDKYDYDAT